jgi:RecA-family ATPase
MDGFADFSAALDSLAKGREKPKPPYEPMRFLSPVSLAGKPVPPREWIVQDWLPAGTVSLSYGDGGIGKSLLAQQLLTSCATGVPWCGLAVTRCPVLGMFCEDDEDELHRRQDAINAHFSLPWDRFGDMHWASGVGQDNVLIRFDHDGTPVMTDRFDDLCNVAKITRARLVLIDTAADTFGGNENDRAQVRQYIGNALTRLAQDINGAVLVNAHPSRSGMSVGGSMDSGSTGWSNSSRSRWALTRPEMPEGEIVDPDERILTRRKANYSSIGDTVKLRWQNGLLVPQEQGAGGIVFTAASRRNEIEATFLVLLGRADEDGRPLSPSKSASNYAAELFSKMPDRRGFTKREFGYALEALLEQKRIKIVPYGAPSRGLTKIVPTQFDAAEDAANGQ